MQGICRQGFRVCRQAEIICRESQIICRHVQAVRNHMASFERPGSNKGPIRQRIDFPPAKISSMRNNTAERPPN